MEPISPNTFGQIHAFVANGLALDLSPSTVVQRAVSEFAKLNPVDVADVAEGAVESWQRLQVTEPSEVAYEADTMNFGVRDGAE